MQDFGRKTFLFPKQSEQQVFGTDMFMIQAFRFLGAICQDAFTLVTERQIDGSGDFVPNSGMSFDLFANGFYGGVRPQKPVCQRLVLAKQSEEQVFGFNIRAAELARFIASEEDHPSRLLRVSLKHTSQRPPYFKDTPARPRVAEGFVLQAVPPVLNPLFP